MTLLSWAFSTVCTCNSLSGVWSGSVVCHTILMLAGLLCDSCIIVRYGAFARCPTFDACTKTMITLDYLQYLWFQFYILRYMVTSLYWWMRMVERIDYSYRCRCILRICTNLRTSAAYRKHVNELRSFVYANLSVFQTKSCELNPN